MTTRRWLPLSLGLMIGVIVLPGSSAAQGTTPASTPAPTLVAASQRARLDANLRVGRAVPGARWWSGPFLTLYSNTIRNPFPVILLHADTLKLTNAQADSIAHLSQAFARTALEVWRPVAEYLGALPDRYDLDEAWSRVSAGFTSEIQWLLVYGPAANALLTPQQQRIIPPVLRIYLDSAGIQSLNPAGTSSARDD